MAVELVKKYYFRKDGVLGNTGYDWVGKPRFNLFPVENDEKLGFANLDGEIVVPIIYDRELHINETVRVGNELYLDLRKNNLYGLLKHNGTIVIDFVWESMKIENLSEYLLPVALNNKWGFVNVNTGKLQIELLYDEVEHFKNGFAPVRLNDKWAIIDTNGTMITPAKYLLDSYFEDDFAIVYEGGTYIFGRKRRDICGSNCKIINKYGYEIISDCFWIDRTGINTFTLSSKIRGHNLTKSVKQFILFSDCIIVITNGKYVEGYVTPQKTYSTAFAHDSTHYSNAKYVGGGEFSAIDYTGKPIMLDENKMKEIKESLLNN